MKRYLSFLTCCIACSSQLHAADIYRWTDENGRVQFSDVAPEKKSATKTDSRQYDVSADQRREAEARAAQEKARAAAATQRKTRTDADEAAKSVAAAQNGQQPAVDSSTDCATQQRLYRESQECFAPYVIPTGIKAEAFQKCTTVLDPSAKCGTQGFH